MKTLSLDRPSPRLREGPGRTTHSVRAEPRLASLLVRSYFRTGMLTLKAVMVPLKRENGASSTGEN
jgi:hypothetical protein